MSVVRTVSPFVGRSQQLDWLERCLREALGGHPQVALLAGEPGIGKTRLLKELRSTAERSGCEVFFGRSHEHLVVPYLPFSPLLSALGATPHDGGGAPTTGVPPGFDGDRDKQAFLALCARIIEHAERRPIFLVLDDLHWADSPTLDLLAHLVFSVADAAARAAVRIMVVGAYRSPDPGSHLARNLARLQREEICQSLELCGLSGLETDELIRGLGLERPSQQLVSTLIRATGANPLFLQEVVHHLVKHGALRERGGFLVANAAELRLPAHVADAISLRTESLSPECREALTLASFLGESFSLGALHAVSDLAEDDLLLLCEEAMQQGLVVSEGDLFQFSHPVVRHVFYGVPNAVRCQRIHARVAAALERLQEERGHGPGDDTAGFSGHLLEVAHHLVAAGPAVEAGKVLEHARRAGDHALGLFAWGEAARYYEAALSAVGGGDRLSLGDRARLLHQAAIAHARNMDVGPCLDRCQRAIEAYRLAGDLPGLAGALIDHTRAQLTLAGVPYGRLANLAPLEQALATLGDAEPGLRGRILASLSEAYWVARDPHKAVGAARQALEIGRQLGDRRLCVEANVGLGLAEVQSLHVAEALGAWQDARSDSAGLDDLWLRGVPLQRIPLALMWLGRLDEAAAVAREATELARRTHDWRGQSLALAGLVAVSVARGDFAAAERHAHEMMLMVRRSRYPWGAALALPALACARAQRGAWPEAHDAIASLVEPGRSFAEAGPEIQLVGWLYRQLIEAEAERAAAVPAKPGALPLDSGKQWRSDTGALAGFCVVAELADRLGDPAMARAPYDALARAAEAGVVFTSGWIFLIQRVLGLAAAVRGLWEVAEEHFTRAIELAAGVGARPELARSRVDFARMLLARGARGDRARAAELIRDASPLLAELAMQPLAALAERLAGKLRVRLPRPPPTVATYPDALHPLEVDILRHIARGRSDQEIAEELVLSPRTVGLQVASILGKIGGDTRAAAAAYAFENCLTAAAALGAEASGVSEGKDPSISRTPPVAPGIVTILYTDMEGSTALLERLGDAPAQALLRTHDVLLRGCLREHQGFEVKHMGDGLVASFSSPSAAIDCAVAMQQALARHNRDHPTTALHVRVGLNSGELLAEEGGLFGAAINAAARICARCRPGGILVSDVVRQLAAGRDGVFTDRGRASLKGFSRRFRLFEVQWQPGGDRAP